MGNEKTTDGKTIPNQLTINALKGIASEIAIPLDFFVGAVGNGSNLLAMSQALPQTKLICYEHMQSGLLFDMLRPGMYEKLYGIAPGSLPRHGLPGTSYQTSIDFPHIREVAARRPFSLLVTDEQNNVMYKEVTGKDLSTHNLVQYDNVRVDEEGYGRSTLAGIGIARRFMSMSEGKNFLVLGYDGAERYDS